MDQMGILRVGAMKMPPRRASAAKVRKMCSRRASQDEGRECGNAFWASRRSMGAHIK